MFHSQLATTVFPTTVPKSQISPQITVPKLNQNQIKRHLFADIEDLKEKLTGYLQQYNFDVRLGLLG